MVRGQHFETAIVEPLAAVMGDAAIGLQQRLESSGTEANDHFRLDGVELAKKKRRAGCDLVRFGLAIAGRAALDDVADVDVAAIEAHGLDHLREKFARTADERQALRVFISAWAFTDEDKLRLRIAIAEDDGVTRTVQFAASAFAEIVTDLQQRFGREFVCGVEE